MLGWEKKEKAPTPLLGSSSHQSVSMLDSSSTRSLTTDNQAVWDPALASSVSRNDTFTPDSCEAGGFKGHTVLQILNAAVFWHLLRGGRASTCDISLRFQIANEALQNRNSLNKIFRLYVFKHV